VGSYRLNHCERGREDSQHSGSWVVAFQKTPQPATISARLPLGADQGVPLSSARLAIARHLELDPIASGTFHEGQILFRGEPRPLKNRAKSSQKICTQNKTKSYPVRSLSNQPGLSCSLVEVATEAEPLSLSIAHARVLLSRLSVFSLLPCLVRARLWHSLP
jgi:hypothetical protein